MNLTIFLIQFMILNTKAEFIWGEAFKDGKLVYIEKHEAKLNTDGTYQELKTEYLNPNKELFASIQSVF